MPPPPPPHPPPGGGGGGGRFSFPHKFHVYPRSSDFLCTCCFAHPCKGRSRMTDRVRRNGQLSSCEPCRHSKLRCDHNRPICGRCVRRGLPQSRCHYHPAPMAMARQSTPQSIRDISHQQQVSRSVATSSSTSTEDSRPYEPINMSDTLMCFNDPNAPHVQRTYTHH
jgi:hypothetical protein